MVLKIQLLTAVCCHCGLFSLNIFSNTGPRHSLLCFCPSSFQECLPIVGLTNTSLFIFPSAIPAITVVHFLFCPCSSFSRASRSPVVQEPTLASCLTLMAFFIQILNAPPWKALCIKHPVFLCIWYAKHAFWVVIMIMDVYQKIPPPHLFCSMLYCKQWPMVLILSFCYQRRLSS